MNKYRVEKNTPTVHKIIQIVPKIAYNIYYKKYEIPTEDEAIIIEYNNLEQFEFVSDLLKKK